jgi:hypothetical protein
MAPAVRVLLPKGSRANDNPGSWRKAAELEFVSLPVKSRIDCKVDPQLVRSVHIDGTYSFWNLYSDHTLFRAILGDDRSNLRILPVLLR